MAFEHWADEHGFSRLSPECVSMVANWVQRLPWGPTRLDWSDISHVMLHLPSLSSEEVFDWMGQMLRDSGEVAIVWSHTEAVIGTVKEMMCDKEDLDDLAYLFPSTALYLFPIVREKSRKRLPLNRFAEFQTPDRMWLPLNGQLNRPPEYLDVDLG